MTITARQRANRRRYLGSSDAPAIVGLSPWRGPRDVWIEKVFGTDDDAPSEAMDTGNRLERALIDYAAERLRLRVVANQFRVSPVAPMLAAHLDALARDRPEAIEAKVVGGGQAEAWRDGPPDYVQLQCQHQAAVAGLERVWVAALVCRVSLAWKLFEVPRDDALIAELIALERAWWRRHVVERIEPDGAAPSADLLRRVRREPGRVVAFDAGGAALVAGWSSARAARIAAERAENAALAEVLAALGDAEAAALPDGRMFRFAEESAGARLDQRALRAEHPDIWSRYAAPATRRVPRLVGGENHDGTGE